MSEETAGAQSAPEGSRAGVDPVVVALALGSAYRQKADALLARQGEAGAQFARAAALDLTPSEKSELASVKSNG